MFKIFPHRTARHAILNDQPVDGHDRILALVPIGLTLLNFSTPSVFEKLFPGNNGSDITARYRFRI